MNPITGPKQTIVVSTRGQGNIYGKQIEKDNLVMTHFHSLSSLNPPIYTISLHKDRFSIELIQNSGVFCINFVDEKMKDNVIKINHSQGKHENKFAKLGFEKEECESIDCPRLKKALSYIECELINKIENGDHVLINGKITKAQTLKDGKRLFHIKDNIFLGI